AVTATLGALPIVKPAHAAVGTVTEYTVQLPSTTRPGYLALGPDNNIWYTNEYSSSRVGKVTPTGNLTQYYPNGSSTYGQYGITRGSDGNLWYADQNTAGVGRIVNMTTSGTVLGTYPLSSGHIPLTLTLGSDGAVWFTESTSTLIGRITTSGTITEYSVPASGISPAIVSITAGPDGNLWFVLGVTGSSNGKVGKITTSGVITTYSISTYSADFKDITTGPDGNLWFTEGGSGKIGKITTSGAITEYTAPHAPAGITTGSDGALWYVENGSNNIGRITTSGAITEYPVSDAQAGSLEHIVTGPDGAVWFNNSYTSEIGRIATELTHQTTSFTSTAPTNAVIDGATYSPTASATSGLPVTITVDSSSSSVCSIDGSGVVSFPGYGTCTLDANQAGNSDYSAAPQVQQSFTVLPVNADTSVALSCPATAQVGTAVTCTITATNNGPAAAENATLTALFPSSLTNASLSGGGTMSGQTITWSVPSLASGASTTLTFSATASVAGKARLDASLLQTSQDPDNSNNIIDATIVMS
ncbi:MAG TPA: hypothetical protein VN081_02710, partial [Dongiaceae bacterium]|nr:hypothetical protein [Dongiaceae bacterium]